MLGCALALFLPCAQGQVLDNGFGSYWLTNAPPAPASFTVGNALFNASAFNIRGNQMGIPTGETFRSFSANGTVGNTRFRRIALWAPDTEQEMGRIFHNIGSLAQPNNGFNIQQTRFQGSLNLMNRRGQANDINYDEPNGNGLRLVDDFNFVCNSYTGNQRFGFIAIGDLDQAIQTTAGNNATPWSRFHLVHNVRDITPEGDGYRQWMRNGVMYTGRGLQMYLGQKYGLTGATEVTGQGSAVLQFGDDALNADRQTMRFLYTVNPDGVSASGAASVEGLELMRIWPQSLTEGFVGIGDFFADNDQPTERLDVRTGRVRIRELANNTLPTRMVVADDDGVLFYQTIGAAAVDCDWTYDDPNDDLTTAWDAGAPAGCPTEQWKVGIGTQDPGSKLSVHNLWPDGTTTFDRGIDVIMAGDQYTSEGILVETNKTVANAERSVGIGSYAWNGSLRTTGLYGYAKVNDGSGGTSGFVTGVEGVAFLDGTANTLFGGRFTSETFPTASSTTHNVFGVHSYVAVSSPVTNEVNGVFSRVDNNSDDADRIIAVNGQARGSYDDVNGWRIGIFGEAEGDHLNRSWAGYFLGDVGATGVVASGVANIITSDGTFKENETPIAGASNLLSQIQPLTYTFDSLSHPAMQLPGGLQAGMVAQDVQVVLPHLVHALAMPARYDSLGNMTSPPLDYLGLNYDGFVPYLIAAFKEQQARIDQQDQQLAAMQQALAACCVGVPTDGTLFQGQGNNTGTGSQDLSRMATEDLLTIAPNPFEERTTISYRAAATGRVMLRVSDGRGQHIDTLRDAMQEAGAYTYEWNTTNLAPGMYTVSLLMDGQLLVERAVKVGR